MIVYVDADACPVKEIIIKICKEFNLKVIMVIDTSHILNDSYCKIITVDKANDSVDFYILNRIKTNDILITQDYGLASIALSKKVFVVNQNGFLYTSKNIDELLFKRYINKQNRKAGKKMAGPKKRTKETNIEFEFIFRSLIQNLIKNNLIND